MVSADAYEAPAPGSFHGGYSDGAYSANVNSGHGFPDYGYSADPSWHPGEQGVCQRGGGRSVPEASGRISLAPLASLSCPWPQLGPTCYHAAVPRKCVFGFFASRSVCLLERIREREIDLLSAGSPSGCKNRPQPGTSSGSPHRGRGQPCPLCRRASSSRLLMGS